MGSMGRGWWGSGTSGLVLGLAALASLVPGCGSAPDGPVAELTPADWAEDLDFVVEVLTERHPDILGYHSVEPATFDAAVERARRTARAGSSADVVLALDRLVGLVGDGHTSLDAIQARAGLGRLPLGTGYFGDELRVFAVAPGHEDALGAEVLALDGTPVSDALSAVSRLISHDNPQEFLYLGPTYLMTPAALRFVGVGTRADSVVLTLRRNGEPLDLPVGAWSQERLAGVDWILARDPDVDPPLYLTRPDEAYWFELLPGDRALYVNWDRVNDADDGPSLGRFYDDLFDVVDAGGVERLVVDLRQNNGGNFHEAEDFIEELLERPALSAPGGLYVLTAPRTFSAATHVAARLRFEANALVVGEPSRGDPNYGYNAEPVALPRSGLHMEYTDRLHDRPPFPDLGELRYLPVDLPAHNAFRDYVEGRDRVLEVALRDRR